MSKILELVFTTDGGKTTTLAVDKPKGPLDVAAVKAVMDTLIAQSVFTSSSGKVAAKKAIRVVDRTVQEYEM
ncbi:MAG: DUF2922 domain-containing protein [Bacillus sp. (in: firmicutes)]